MDEVREPETASSSSERETLEWTVRLWRRNPGRLAVVAFVALLAGVIGFWALRHPVGLLIGAAMIALSTADFWLPIRYQLTDVEAKRSVGFSHSAIPWSAIVQVREDDLGAKLSPLRDPASRLEPFRGVYLLFDGNREAVMQRIQQQVSDSCNISGAKN